MNFSDIIVPLVISMVVVTGIIKKRDVFNDFVEGAESGLRVCVKILPSLIALMMAVGMMRASGLLMAITHLLGSAAEVLDFPSECIPLALIRPFSGSGALSVFSGLLGQCGADSYEGRVASVLMGSTETTFYTIAVYFSATKVKKTSYCAVSALIGDFTGFLMSVIAVKLLMGVDI